MRRFISAFAAVIFFAASLPAEDAMPAALAPYIDEQSVAVVRVDLARIDLDVAFKRLAAINGGEKAVAASKQMATAIMADLRKAGVGIAFVAVNMADITDIPSCLVLPLAMEADGPNVINALKKIDGIKDLTIEAKNSVVIAASPAVMRRMKAMKPAARPDLAAGLAAGKDAAIHIVFAPSADLRRVADETIPNLPKDVGGGPIQIFSRGLIWAALSLDLTPKLAASLVVQTTDAATAKKMGDAVRAIVKNALKEWQGKDAEAVVALATKVFSPTVEGDRLVSRIDEPQFNALFTEMVMPVRAAASRTHSVNNLKQLALSMHVFLDSNQGRFPADILDKEGKPLLSWRVRLLPFLEQKQLYEQFKLDEPWDSEHNKKLIAKIPATFVAPGQKSPAGTTTYLGPLGEGYLFRPKAKQGLKINEITDGTSNTIMIVETADTAAIEWTKPGDWTPDVKDPFKDLVGHYPQGINAAFCDGSVRFINKNYGKKLVMLLTFAGGELADINDHNP